MGADSLALARTAGDQVVGVGDLDPRHRPADRAVVEEAQVLVAGLGDQRVRLLGVDLAAHQQRELAAGVPGLVPLEPALEVGEQQLRDPGVEDLLGDGLPSSVGCQEPVSSVFSRSMTSAQPASKM